MIVGASFRWTDGDITTRQRQTGVYIKRENFAKHFFIRKKTNILYESIKTHFSSQHFICLTPHKSFSRQVLLYV